METVRQMSREAFLEIVSHVYGPERAMEARNALPDSLDFDRDAPLLERLGRTIDGLYEAFAFEANP
jgi:hypothetical protein